MFVSLLLPFGGDLLSTVIESPAEAAEVGASRPGAKPPKKGGKKRNGDGDPGTGPFKKADYPLQERLRPLILPNSMGEVTPSLGFQFTDPLIAGLGAHFRYGFGNKVDVGVSTGLLLAPDADWNRNITLEAHFLAYDSSEFDFGPGVRIPLTFVDGAQVGAQIDLTSRWVPSDFFLVFGQNAIDVVAASEVGLNINGNVRLGYQVSKPAALFLDTNVFSLALAPDSGFTGLWEYINLGIGGQYTPTRTVDLGAALTYVNFWELEGANAVGLNLYGKIRF
jgi:hypothetical protein